MAFAVNDLQDFLSLLREHPEWRADVRKEILGDELLALPDLVKDLATQLSGLREELSDLRVELHELVAEIHLIATTAARLTDEMAENRSEHSAFRGISLELWYRNHPEVLTVQRSLRRIRSLES